MNIKFAWEPYFGAIAPEFFGIQWGEKSMPLYTLQSGKWILFDML